MIQTPEEVFLVMARNINHIQLMINEFEAAIRRLEELQERTPDQEKLLAHFRDSLPVFEEHRKFLSQNMPNPLTD